MLRLSIQNVYIIFIYSGIKNKGGVYLRFAERRSIPDYLINLNGNTSFILLRTKNKQCYLYEHSIGKVVMTGWDNEEMINDDMS